MICGEQVHITDGATKSSRWGSEDMHFTLKEQELLTTLAQAILADKDKAPQ